MIGLGGILGVLERGRVEETSSLAIGYIIIRSSVRGM